MDVKAIITSRFTNLIKNNNLITKLSFIMPKGYEDAFGTYNILNDTLFLNLNNYNKERILFTFFHELRHCEQYQFSNKFNLKIQTSLNYVILYNGECYKLLGNKWKKSKLKIKRIDFLEIYKNLPYELDANKYAYKKVKEILKNDCKELEIIYKNSLPIKIIDFKILKEFFKEIDIKFEN